MKGEEYGAVTRAQVMAVREILQRTFAVEHNPNCPSPFLVRLVGNNSRGFIEHTRVDACGYGRTFAEAAAAAIRIKNRGGEGKR